MQLHYAATRGHAGTISSLLERGVSPAAQDERGLTPLHWAAANGKAECVALLLRAGAPVAAADDEGRERDKGIETHAADPAQDPHGREPRAEAIRRDAR